VKIKLDASGLRQSHWSEYLVRFVFGGAVTALAGVIAKRFGPEIGGLFLAFPAILPATATLIEKHEKQKKERAGKEGTERGRVAAGVDAVGASMGSVGLVVFALVVWQRLPHSATGIVLTGATLAWFVTSVALWELRETLWRRARAHRFNASNSPLHTSVRRKLPTKNKEEVR
jgi:hypothetical protein